MLLLVGAAIAIVVLNAPIGAAKHAGSARAGPAHARHTHRHAPYWTVRPGNTLAQIAANTGVSVNQLEAYNPAADPQALTIGERLRLWTHPPRPPVRPPRSPGPVFWTVQAGESYGSIAAATGINLHKLEQLNPRLAPTNVQPGDQIRLRPATTVLQAAMLARLWLREAPPP
jgi:LysM repeat protein